MLQYRSVSSFLNSKHWTIIFPFVLLINCAGESSDCQLGKPTPIFPEGISTVQQRSFTEKNNSSTEHILFQNGLELDILQDGCDYVRQEFQFTLSERSDTSAAGFWAQKAADLFTFMADQSEQLKDFHLWAGAIESVAPDIRMGQPTPLDGPFTIKIDKIDMGDNQTILRVVLSNEPEQAN